MIQTISLSDDLAERIAEKLLNTFSEDPIGLAESQIILPTRRACRSLKEAFSRIEGEKSLILPQMIPLYDLDDLGIEIPESISPLERTLLLAKLCAAKPNINTPDQAIKVALSLGNLLDEFYQFETNTDDLEQLVPEQIFAEHWNETIVFLNIITKMWPKILQEKNKIDQVDARIRMINAFSKRLESQNPQYLVVAAGLDGGLPSVKRLLNVINRLKNGVILLDGADLSLTESQFHTLPPHHYQNSIHQILESLNLLPQQVQFLSSPISERENLIIEALKPESRTDEWRHTKLSEHCLDHVKRIDCDTVSEEALTIALLLRQVLETPDKTAALVTPDRNLARRVIMEMKRWGVMLDDSAGTPLTQTDIGIYLRLLATVGTNGCKDSDLLSLLKHPYVADKMNPMSFRHLVRKYELNARKKREKLNIQLNTDILPFVELLSNNKLTSFKILLSEHIKIAENLATSNDRSAKERIWSDEAGKATFNFLTDLLEKSDLIGEIEPVFYPEILDMLLSGITVRPLYGMNSRLDILGPIESRFHHPDVCILAGLNEGTFPGFPDIGPWLNRQMRQTLGLPPVETKTASVSMDFAHCFCSPTVYLVRSCKADGAETISSRFLSRISAVLQGSNISEKIYKGNWSQELDTPCCMDIIQRPAPCPPVDARPQELSVTKIELWMRNPYAIYARYILNLFPLDPLEKKQKQQIYGSAVHKILEKYIQNYLHQIDLDILKTLAINTFTEYGLSDTDISFYLPRFMQTALFFLDAENTTRHMISKSLTEQTGQITFDVFGRSFTLKGTADRIDLLKNGTIRIIDYKTGGVPSAKEVWAGYAPQLPLEALILSKGGFPEIPPHPISQLSYWKLASKKEDCKITDIMAKSNQTSNEIIQESFDGLKSLIHVFNQPNTPYEACPVPGKAPEYNDYEHLSRSAEWIHDGEQDDD